jgi:hypothetical protein
MSTQSQNIFSERIRPGTLTVTTLTASNVSGTFSGTFNVNFPTNSGLKLTNGLIGINPDTSGLGVNGATLSLNSVISGNRTFTDEVTISGFLNVTGTQSISNLSNLSISNSEIILLDGATGSPTLNASITIKRGNSPYARVLWDEINDNWKVGVSGSETSILTTAGFGLTKSGDMISLDLQVQGPTGPQGASGPTGAIGPQGDPGVNGVPGDQGSQGPTGVQGFTGQQGTTGPQGFQGPTGIGTQGPAGTQGVTGTQGFTGPQGVTGPVGGGTGATGVQGPTGTQGVTGPQGPTGFQGTTGPQGITGPIGNIRNDAFVTKAVTITHSFGYYPIVQAFWSNGTRIYDNDYYLTHSSTNVFTIDFTNYGLSASGFTYGTVVSGGAGFAFNVDNYGDNRILTSNGTLTSSTAEVNLTFDGLTFTVSATSSLSGHTTFQQTSEKVSTLPVATASLVTYNFNDGSIWYHSTASSNYTADFINLPTTDNRAITATIIISQGPTGYAPTSVRISGVTQSIKWSSGTYSVSTNKVDIVGFTFLRTSATWSQVFGQISSFS